MNGMHNLPDLDTFLNSQEDHSERIPVLCEITYDGDYVIPYASMAGYHVSNANEKLAEYDYALENIPKSEKEEFAYATFAMIPGQTSRFTIMLCADDMKHPADDDSDTMTYFEIAIPGFDVNFNWASEGAVDILLGDDTVEDVYAYLADVAAEISADAPAVSDDVVTEIVSKDFTLTKSSDVYWRINEVKLRTPVDEVNASAISDYMLDTSIIRTHSVDLTGMDISFDENANSADIFAMLTPEVEPDSEVVVSVRTVPYVTKKGVYEIHVQTSTGKVISGDDENSAEETWTDEEPLVFEVSTSAGSPNSGSPSEDSPTEDSPSTDSPSEDEGTDSDSDTKLSSSGAGCDTGLSVAGLAIGLSLLLVKRKR